MLSKLLPPICCCCLFNTLNSCFDIPSLCVCESECASLLIIMSSLHMQRYARASVCVRAAFAAVVVPSLSLLCFFILKLVSKFNYTALCCSCCAARNFAFCSTVFTCFVVLINQFSNTVRERGAHRLLTLIKYSYADMHMQVVCMCVYCICFACCTRRHTQTSIEQITHTLLLLLLSNWRHCNYTYTHTHTVRSRTQRRAFARHSHLLWQQIFNLK